MPKVFVERCLKARPEMAPKVVDLLRLEVVRQREMTSCLLLHKAETKLARLLPLLARRFGEEDEVGLVIRLRLTQEELAKMVSTTRESVCQALASLRRQGLLALVAGRMVILDPAGLERLAHGPARKGATGPNLAWWPASPVDHA